MKFCLIRLLKISMDYIQLRAIYHGVLFFLNEIN